MSYANVIGHGAANQYSRCENIDWSEAQAGDLVFYPDLGHVGIIAGTDDNGNLLVVHCASSQNIDWSEAQAGDLVFYPDLGHVGIIAGTDDNGNLLVVHCASPQNNVVVTGLQRFTKIGRPVLFD